MKTQILHTVLCYISGQAAGEIWNSSLLIVKGLGGFIDGDGRLGPVRQKAS